MQRQLVFYSKYSKLWYNNYKKNIYIYIINKTLECWHLHDKLGVASLEDGTSSVARLRGPLFGVGLLIPFSMLPFLPDTFPHI